LSGRVIFAASVKMCVFGGSMTVRSIGRWVLFVCLFGVTISAWASGPHGGGNRQSQNHAGASTDKSQKETVESDQYDPKAVTMTVVSSGSGVIERIVTNDTADATQIGRVRAALQKEVDALADRQFATPVGVRRDASWLATLQTAPAGAIRARYFEVRAGGEVRYGADDPAVLAALSDWLTARQSAPPPPLAMPDRH